MSKHRQNVTDAEAVQILNEVLVDYAKLLGLPTDPTDTEDILIAIEALQAERDAAQAEVAALRRRLWEVENVKRYMAEQIARRLPDELRQSVTTLHDVLAKPLYDPMTGELAPAEAT